MASCLTYSQILDRNGSVVENSDGTVSVFFNEGGHTIPFILNETCCRTIKPNYFFDIDTQTCRWSESVSCSLEDAFKLVLNPNGNDGSLFNVDSNENCTLSIDFDYLFKIKCETLNSVLNNVVTLTPQEIQLQQQIDSLHAQIAAQNALCQTYTNQIITLTQQIQSTKYSILCEQTPQEPTFGGVSPVNLGNFGNTGFGIFSFAGTGTGGSGEINGITFCLTEPEGLAQWENILGSVDYQKFLNGQTSYSCSDVQEIVNLNNTIVANNLISANQTPVLLNQCNTPINTKANLVKQLAQVNLLQSNCNALIQELHDQLDEVEQTLTDISDVCTKPIDVFETLDVSLTLDIITSANTLQTISEYSLFPEIGYGNLYNYLISNTNSGFYVCGDPTVSETTFSPCTPLTLNVSGVTQPNVYNCNLVMNDILQDLFTESELSGLTNANSIFNNSISSSAFTSQWLHYNTVITDPNILNQINNKKIKISIKINHACTDFCVLIDNISLNKVCYKVDKNNIFLTQSPGFEIERIRDNKKSWKHNSTLVNRNFNISDNNGNRSIRQTNYDVNDERLVINSKEIDLDISLASAIETDVLCYLNDNPCILTGVTTCNPCEDCGNKSFMDDMCFEFMDSYLYEFMDGTYGTGTTIDMFGCCGDNRIDFTELLTQPLSDITTVEDFEYFMTSELIDAKNRQTLSGYPTLRALYHRYLNSSLYCNTNSSAYSYLNIDQFANLIGNYWVDIVEQVIPSTTIWGSVKIYSNTIFDQQKFKYRSYSSLFCNNPYNNKKVSSPINGTNGICHTVSVSLTPIQIKKQDTVNLQPIVTTTCNSVCIAQMNVGSEFIGTISVIGSGGGNGGHGTINPDFLDITHTDINHNGSLGSGLGTGNGPLTGGVGGIGTGTITGERISGTTQGLDTSEIIIK